MTRPPVTPNGLIQELQTRVEVLEALIAHLAALVCRDLMPRPVEREQPPQLKQSGYVEGMPWDEDPRNAGRPHG